MKPVAGGWVSHKIKGDGDYEAQKRAALAQSKTNSYTQGVQDVMVDGPGVAIQNSRTRYGNVNLMPNQVLQGATSNFQAPEAPGNQPLLDLPNQSGAVFTQASSTNVPQQDPGSMETDALERRLSLYAKGMSWGGYNDHARGL